MSSTDAARAQPATRAAAPSVEARSGQASVASLPVRPSAEARGVDPADAPPTAPPTRAANADDPAAERARRFHAGLGVIADASRRRAQLERARRVAPFDLTWGLW